MVFLLIPSSNMRGGKNDGVTTITVHNPDQRLNTKIRKNVVHQPADLANDPAELVVLCGRRMQCLFRQESALHKDFVEPYEFGVKPQQANHPVQRHVRAET